MKQFWILTILAVLVAAQKDEAVGRKPDASNPAGATVAVNTRAGAQPNQQDLRFSPAFLGNVLNAGAQILGTALGGRPGHNHNGHGQHHNHNSFGHGHNTHGQSHGLNFGQTHGHNHGHHGHRPHRPHRPNRPIGFGQGFGHGGFGHAGHNHGGHSGSSHGGFGQGGFGQGGFGQGGFGQGGFGQGGFGQGGFGQGGFGQGGFGQGGFGNGGIKGGTCPPVRSVCPLRGNFGPTACRNDFQCTAADKCCFDKCLNQKVCKPPQ